MSPGIRGLLLLLALTQLLLQVRAIGPESGRIGLDFYQYWVVGQVVSLTAGKVRNPYTQQPQFSAVANAHAARASDTTLAAVASLRADLELQATPFAYTFFSLYPKHYGASLHLHQVAQISAFVLAIFLLLGREAAADRLLVAFVAMPVFGPLTSDLAVANFNCFLLLFLTLTFRLAERALAVRDGAGNGILYAAGAVTLALASALLKPSLMFVAPLLAVAICARMRTAGIGAIALGALAGVGLAALPAWYFDSIAIWLEWKHYFDNGNVDMYSLPFERGNLSMSALIVRATGLPLMLSILALLTALSLSSIGVVQVMRGGALAHLKRLLVEPASVISLAVLLFFAVSPLAWLHYHLLLLVPALLLVSHRGRVGLWAMVIVLLLSTNALTTPLGLAMDAESAQTIGFYGTMLAWPALWFLVLFADVRPEAKPACPRLSADMH